MGFLLLLRYHPQARNCLISSHASRDFLEGRKSKGGWMGSSRKTESARKGLGKKEYISTREVEEEKRCYIIGITDCQWQHACNICAKNEKLQTMHVKRALPLRSEWILQCMSPESFFFCFCRALCSLLCKSETLCCRYSLLHESTRIDGRLLLRQSNNDNKAKSCQYFDT